MPPLAVSGLAVQRERERERERASERGSEQVCGPMRACAHLLLINALLGELVRGCHLIPLAIGIKHIGRRPPVVLGIATGGRVGSIGLWSTKAAIERDRCVEACRWREASGRSLEALLRVSRLR